mmetsp:Transcript_34909/g.56323  ORF Transcript_34909/g.56323 Transcript_34909/m.56323 type:complete len:208 (-) Transcript_34909:1493-2116(-)
MFAMANATNELPILLLNPFPFTSNSAPNHLRNTRDPAACTRAHMRKRDISPEKFPRAFRLTRKVIRQYRPCGLGFGSLTVLPATGGMGIGMESWFDSFRELRRERVKGGFGVEGRGRKPGKWRESRERSEERSKSMERGWSLESSPSNKFVSGYAILQGSSNTIRSTPYAFSSSAILFFNNSCGGCGMSSGWRSSRPSSSISPSGNR